MDRRYRSPPLAMKRSASNQPSAFWNWIAPGVLGMPFVMVAPALRVLDSPLAGRPMRLQAQAVPGGTYAGAG